MDGVGQDEKRKLSNLQVQDPNELKKAAGDMSSFYGKNLKLI
jgi:hypothetical protein